MATVAGNLGVPALGTAVMVLMLRFLMSPEWWLAAAVAAAGETTGQLAQYCMARFGARAIVDAFSQRYSAGAKHHGQFEAFYRKYGGVAVLLCRFIPGVKAFSGFPAGLAKMALAPFVSYTLVGSSVCWLVLSWVLHEAGGRSPTVSGFARQHAGADFRSIARTVTPSHRGETSIAQGWRTAGSFGTCENYHTRFFSAHSLKSSINRLPSAQ